MNRGVVVVGYQGIGKSTLALQHLRYIDLESSCFRVDGVRPENWAKIYANQAIHIASQGRVVFVSSHAVLRDALLSNFIPPCVHVMACVPSIDLESSWIERLHDRYDKSKSSKDFNAWKNAEDRYAENIKEIMTDFPEDTLIIDRMEYSLDRLLQYFFQEHNYQVYY